MQQLRDWRDAVRSDRGPPSSTTRQVLIEVSLWMNNDTLIAYPSEETIAKKCRLSVRSVRTHLKLAADQGWISRKLFRPAGKQWPGYCYTGGFPHGHSRPEGRSGIPAPIPESDAPRPESDSSLYRNDVPTNSVLNSNENSTSQKEHEGPHKEVWDRMVREWPKKLTASASWKTRRVS
jgi:hypothetical protein